MAFEKIERHTEDYLLNEYNKARAETIVVKEELEQSKTECKAIEYKLSFAKIILLKILQNHEENKQAPEELIEMIKNFLIDIDN